MNRTLLTLLGLTLFIHTACKKEYSCETGKIRLVLQNDTTIWQHYPQQGDGHYRVLQTNSGVYAFYVRSAGIVFGKLTPTGLQKVSLPYEENFNLHAAFSDGKSIYYGGTIGLSNSLKIYRWQQSVGAVQVYDISGPASTQWYLSGILVHDSVLYILYREIHNGFRQYQMVVETDFQQFSKITELVDTDYRFLFYYDDPVLVGEVNEDSIVIANHRGLYQETISSLPLSYNVFPVSRDRFYVEFPTGLVQYQKGSLPVEYKINASVHIIPSSKGDVFFGNNKQTILNGISGTIFLKGGNFLVLSEEQWIQHACECPFSAAEDIVQGGIWVASPSGESNNHPLQFLRWDKKNNCIL